MPQRLRELIESKDLDGFESRCLELLETGQLPLGELATCFELINQAGQAERIPPLAQMVLENIDLDKRAAEALKVVCAGLYAAPKNDELRRAAVEIYERVYGQTEGFAAILESSGLTTGRPARAALRVLDFCLALNVGETLISRMDDRVVEVVEIDRPRGLFTLRRHDRATTIPARELVREYERIDAEDFRVLQQLRPERLPELIHNDPVAVVIGLIHAHGEHIDADRLKHELVPKHISSQEWSKWWTKARTKLKRSPHVIIEGRSPIVLSYSAEGVTLEEETWTAIASQDDPVKWLGTAENYLRELKVRKHKPDEALLKRFHNHIVDYIAKVRPYRPGEALACALVLGQLGEHGLPISDESKELAAAILREAEEPAELMSTLADDGLWKRVLAELPRARPEDWGECAVALFPSAPASQLDALIDQAREAGQLDAVQRHIDDSLADPLDYPELIYWLWKGPKNLAGLRPPSDGELFRVILDTVRALDTILTPPPEVSKQFRGRVKSALALRHYAKVCACFEQASPAAAITLRGQLERMDGLGPNARSKMLDLLREAHPQLWTQQVKQIAPWEDPDTIWATEGGIRRKTAERDELINVKMHENAVRIGEAAAMGDLSENSEYKFALEERDFLRARLARINHDLSIARTLMPHDVPSGLVGIGTRVSLRHLVNGTSREMTFFGPFETDVDNGIYSYKAPVCQKLMGRKPGEHVTLTIDDAEHEFEIASIENVLPT